MENINIDDETIDFNKLNLNTNTPEINKKIEQDNLIDQFVQEYLANLKDTYEPEDNLFNIISELLEESEDKEKSIQILNSL